MCFCDGFKKLRALYSLEASNSRFSSRRRLLDCLEVKRVGFMLCSSKPQVLLHPIVSRVPSGAAIFTTNRKNSKVPHQGIQWWHDEPLFLTGISKDFATLVRRQFLRLIERIQKTNRNRPSRLFENRGKLDRRAGDD